MSFTSLAIDRGQLFLTSVWDEKNHNYTIYFMCVPERNSLTRFQSLWSPCLLSNNTQQ